MPTDPVCGMFVPENSDISYEADQETYYFCSTACRQLFSSPELEYSRLRKRLTVGWALSVPVLVISYALSPSYFGGISYKDYLLMFLSFPVQFYSGYGFYQGAYHAVRSFTGNMDLLVSVGTLTAFIFSAYVTLAGQSNRLDVFFDASVFIITMILTGNFIENMTKKKSNSAARKLLSLIPDTVHFKTGIGEFEERKADSVNNGDILLIKPGENVPVDGIIVEGRSEVDESMLTGEQMPSVRVKGDRVYSGTLNLNGSVEIEVTGTGKNSTVIQIYEMIQKAVSGRAKVQRISDVFSSLFVPVVMITATVSSIFWYIYLSSIGYASTGEISLLAFVSVIVVACPCAIGLAVPISLLISSGKASERGVIIKNPNSFDRLSKVTMFMFDKTGTLTESKPTVGDILVEDSSVSKEYILLTAASVESRSNHPVAKAIVNEALKSSKSLREASDIVEIPGKGISGTVDGLKVEISRSDMKGVSSVSVIVSNRLIGKISLIYRIRDSAFSAIADIKGNGFRVSMITGDSEGEALRVAENLGIDDVHYEVLPGEKAEIIRKYQERGDYLMFVGDGINDSVALETADVGVAMGSGTDIARESGDIILLSNDLEQVQFAKLIGIRTISKIKQNMAWAVGYNIMLIPVAAGVLVPFTGLSIFFVLPMISAFAMGMSSTSVIINSLFLRGKIDSDWKNFKGSSIHSETSSFTE